MKALLFDGTRCIGCGACYAACKEKNDLPQGNGNFLEDDLSSETYTVVKQRNGRFIRRLCMHCETPTCASVCPVAALEKTSTGSVVYHEDRCIGCRYCMVACPFNIPRYEWDERLPRIRKCDFCADRLVEGLPTACAEVCPTGATGLNERNEVVQEARRRILTHPASYVDYIYGLEEVGGTSVLLLSGVSFESLGYRAHFSKEPLPLLTWNVLKKVPNIVLVGGVLLYGIWWITNRRAYVQRLEGEERKKRE